MSTVKERNYESPEAVLRGLIVRGFVVAKDANQREFPINGCSCRGCRLVRKAYKLANLPIPTDTKAVVRSNQ